MESIFTKIVNRKVNSYIVAEDDSHLAFLDIAPLAKGHVLVIPKQQTDYIFDIENTQYLALWKFAKKVAKSMQKTLPCIRIGVSVIGLEVPHAHIHLVPINDINDINFANKKIKISATELNNIAELIKSAI